VPYATESGGSKYFQAGGSNVLIKFCDAVGVTAQYRFNGDYSLVSASKPYYFWRMTVMGGHVRKIKILRDEHISIVLGVLPDDPIV